MDSWHLPKLTCRDQVSIDIADGTADHLLIMMCVVPLLAYRRIKQHDCATDKVDQLFVDELGACLVLAALVTSGLSSELTNCVLKAATYVSAPNSVDPFKLNFDVVWLPQVVMYCLVLQPVSNDRLQGSIQPRPEVQRTPILSQLGRLLTDELHNIGWKSFLWILFT